MSLALLRIAVCLIVTGSFFSPAAYAQEELEFSFITGSCAHLEASLQDSAGVMYRGDTSILYTMAHSGADFMLWLGDNWYLNNIEAASTEGLNSKARNTLAMPVLQRLLHDKPNYAIWDDHDYGPDNSDSHYPLKAESRNIFMRTWKLNPSYGAEDEGIYTSFRKGDALFILLDDRWWRSPDALWDYKWFQPNKKKTMWGSQQMAWLKKTLIANSDARFKIIVNGSQVVNPLAKGDCHIHFPVEHIELMSFLDTSGIKGVVFLSGDRHHGEIIKLPRKDRYPLYDITSSPLTSDIDPVRGRERRNRYRIDHTLVQVHHYTQVNVTGEGRKRRLVITFRDNKGKMLANYDILASELGWQIK